jgi:hypothetical protein
VNRSHYPALCCRSQLNPESDGCAKTGHCAHGRQLLNPSTFGFGLNGFRRGSRSKRVASRLRYAAEPSVRPLTSAARSADSASADGLRLDEIGEAAGATLEERCNAHGSPHRALPDARERSTGASLV